MKPYLAKSLLVFFVPILVVSAIPTSGVLAQGGEEGEGAEFFMAPQSGDAIVGETFQVSVYLDTNGNTINAIDAKIKFPADKLQVISPSVGRSIIGIWTAPPSFDNTNGELRFIGGIPTPGISTSQGLISTITFRVRSVGTASLSFIGEPKILLNDGFGTNILTGPRGASFSLGLPLPQGPIVSSPSHPEQDKWYKNRTPVLQWTSEFGSIQGYSYSLSNEPIDIPDDISEGINTEVSYKNLPDDLHYFHIKALRSGNWGGATHFAIKIDSTPPANFQVQILPEPKTTSHFPIINFDTTDAFSGISHYELRIVPLSQSAEDASQKGSNGFFIEAQTRYIAEVGLGEYDVIVRAYDNAGNYRESAQHMSIITPILTFSRTGIELFKKYQIPWWMVILIGLIILALFVFLTIMAIRMHRRAHMDRMEGALNDPQIKRRLEELQRRRETYKNIHHKIAVFILLVSVSMLTLPSVRPAKAQETVTLPPPIVTSVPLNISNDQLFYVGGQTDVVDSDVIIFLQNIQDGQVIRQTVTSDQKGSWFYAYKEPLISGSYLLWTQGKIGNQLSPPSPQKQISVSRTALQLGASRLSFETLYLFVTIILFGAVLALGSYSGYHFFSGRRKRRDLMKEIEEADNVIKDGFQTLHEDISAELNLIHKAKLSKSLSAQEEEREARLLQDLAEIEKFIKKEFKDVKLKSRTV